jgi:hypothetical protein
VTKAQAGLQQAAIDAQTNAKKQEGYNACPVCGQMDLLDHLPAGITTYARARRSREIDAQSGDFDDQFRAGERRAHDRGFLLNSSLSP